MTPPPIPIPPPHGIPVFLSLIHIYLLLASLAYTEEDAADKFPKDIAAMEQSLKRLEEQEQKYSAELDAALNEYAGLREQAQGFDPVQLYEARQASRPSKEQEAENRAQEVYGEKYSPLLMFDSKKAVSHMPVSYTHLDVYKRQMQHSGATPISSTTRMMGGRAATLTVPHGSALWRILRRER